MLLGLLLIERIRLLQALLQWRRILSQVNTGEASEPNDGGLLVLKRDGFDLSGLDVALVAGHGELGKTFFAGTLRKQRFEFAIQRMLGMTWIAEGPLARRLGRIDARGQRRIG